MIKAVTARAPLPHLDDALTQLRNLLGERISTSAAVRAQHSTGVFLSSNEPPDVVAFAQSTAEVVEIVKICAANAIPIIPFGTGTSVEGHIAAPLGGLSLDVSRMDKVLKVNSDDLDVVVEPGVTRKMLNSHIRDTGLFFPIDPGADASLGGMAATRASGTNAVRYGTMRENTLALQVVTADGRVIRTGGRARKSSAGYDLTHVYVGSEGTLGIITELTLRLYGIPEKTAAAVCSFATLEGAVDTVITTIQAGVPIARIELLDDVQIDILNKHAKFDFPVLNTLFMEFHGTEAGVQEQVEMVQAIASDNGGGNFTWKTQAEERTKLWQARHDATWVDKQAYPGWDVMATDVCVPISQLAEVVTSSKQDAAENGLVAPIVGHVGDGNFHMLVMVKPDDPAYFARVHALNDRLIARALAAGGTCTGEHGIGLGKVKHLYKEHGDSMHVMLAIKQALDPQNIMNPGKIFAPAN